MSRPGLDVIVVNYKTPSDLSRFLHSFAEHPPSCDYDVRVVNVCPEDLDCRVAHEWVTADARFHHCVFTDNVGYGRACNTAARLGDRELVAFFNADIALTAGALDACSAALVSRDDWGILGPRQHDDRGYITCAGIFGGVLAPKHRGFHEHDHGQYVDVRDDATYAMGSALFTRRTLFNELTDCPDGPGTFLLQTPHYYEESFACRHALAHGHKIVYLGTTTIVHQWHRASKVGGWAEQQMPYSKRLFDEACDQHGLDHE